MDEMPITRPMTQDLSPPHSPEQPSPILPADASAPAGWRSHLAHNLPTAVVLIALAGLGLYGHHSGWKLPKFSQLFGATVAEPDDWCAEHAVPESQCIECRPDLLPRGRDFGWCEAHGIHNCLLEHPEAAQLKSPPAVQKGDREWAARALALMQRPKNNDACKNYRRRIQFASHAAVLKAGVDIAPFAKRQPIRETVTANGEITYDPTRLASLSSRLPGTVWRVEKKVGDHVSAGEVLALIEAPDVGRAKAELIQALAEEGLKRKSATRLQPLSLRGELPAAQLDKAEAERIQAKARLIAAQQVLGNLGLAVNVADLQGLAEDAWGQQLRFVGLPGRIAQHLGADATANLLPLKASRDGTIIECRAVAGEVVDSSRILFQVADTGRMWLTFGVPLEDIRWLAVGQAVGFRPDGGHEEVQGHLTWISTTADPQTRMVVARAELPNPQGRLRNATYGQGRIILREEREAIVVPSEAVHWEGCCHVIFVRDQGYFDRPDSPKVFHVREVRLGVRSAEVTEVIAGVLPGEVVATKGSDVLRAELLKNNLGEGCCSGE